MKKQFLEIGKIVTTHGIKGEVRVQPWCDDAGMLCEFEHLYFHSGKESVQIETARVHKNVVVMKLTGVDTVNEAQGYRNRILYVDRDELELPSDTYFVQDLIGLSVVHAETGWCYGELVEVTETGANDVYHIKTPTGGVVLVPAIADVVKATDIDGGMMKIIPLRGLFDEVEEIREDNQKAEESAQ